MLKLYRPTHTHTPKAKQVLAVSLLYVLHYDQHCYYDPVCYDTDGTSCSYCLLVSELFMAFKQHW